MRYISAALTPAASSGITQGGKFSQIDGTYSSAVPGK
jgi:hypothetical protein